MVISKYNQKEIIKSIGKRKLVFGMLKLFKQLCSACKQKAMQNPKRDWHDYCPICQGKIEKIVGKMQR